MVSIDSSLISVTVGKTVLFMGPPPKPLYWDYIIVYYTILYYIILYYTIS